VGGVSGAGGATSGAGGQETGGAGGSVTSGVCEGVKRASVVSELIAYQSPYTLGGYTLTYVGSSSENSIDMSIECASTGESLGSVVAPYARIGSDQFGTFADSVNNMGVSVQVHSYSAGAARISVNVTSQ
ncbi:hypothetical protein JXA56_03995, partial [Candidatus Micrarchaeota archaeon]|nr:hypothetical protein [Candidatus Micrarchaeota archaeon]